MFKRIFLFFFIAITTNSFAQYYTSGDDPASVHWRYFKNKHVTLLFPVQSECFAKNIFNLASNDSLLRAIGFVKTKLPIVVHSYISISNGMVAWAPKRVELNAIPDQSIYPEIWYRQLAIHEFRHVAQFELLNQGLTKGIATIFGQHFLGALIGRFPVWLLEGDAVWHETRYGYSGRGRMSDFLMQPAAFLDENKKVKYENLFFGSYNYFVPDYYKMGYINVAYGYMKKDKLWSRAFANTGRRPYTLVPVNRVLIDAFSMKKAKFTIEAMSYFKHRYDSINAAFSVYKDVLTSNSNDFISYEYPFTTSKKTIVALKSGMSYPSQFVEIDSLGVEHTLFNTGYVMERSVDVKNDILVWSENVNDIRWDNRSYSDVFMYNISEDRIYRISKNKYYYAPSISVDMKNILVVENGPDGVSRIKEIELATRKILKNIELDSNKMALSPKWLDDNTIVFIQLDEKGKSIRSLSLNNLKQKEILKPAFVDIASLFIKGDSLIYESCQGKKREIHAFLLKEKIDKQLTDCRYGAFYPSVNKNKLIFSEYTENGYKIKEVSLETMKWQTSLLVKVLKDPYFAIDTTGLSMLYSFKSAIVDSAKAKKYHKMAHLFYFHSWAPVYIDPNDPTNVLQGLSIMSQNALGTAITSLGYYKMVDDIYNTYYVDFSYSGLYPKLDLSYVATTQNYRISYSERALFSSQSFRPTVTLPFDFSLGKMNRKLVFTGCYSFDNYYQLTDSKNYFQQKYYSTYLQFYNLKRTSIRDLRPSLGFSTLVLRSFSLHNDLKGKFYAKTYVYLPGIMKHHSFVLAYEYQKYDNYPLNVGTFGSSITLPVIFNKLDIYDMSVFSASYRFPLVYPDLRIGSLMYLKRIDLNLFANRYQNVGQTVGVDVNAESNIFRLPYPVNFGLRVYYSPNLRKFGYDILSFSINF